MKWGLLREAGKGSGADAEGGLFEALLLEEGEEEVGHGGVFRELVVVALVEVGGVAGEDCGDGFGGVACPAEGTAAEDGGVVEHGGTGFGGTLEFAEEVGELGDVEGVEADELFFLFFGCPVGEGVVAVGGADFSVDVVGGFAAGHEGGDAGGIGLEGEDGHVEHGFEETAAGAFGVGVGCGGGTLGFGLGFRRPGFGAFDLFFHFADGGEVFVELLLVGAPEVAVELLGWAEDGVEDALFAFEAAEGLLEAFFGFVAEEAFEDGADTAFSGDGDAVGAPCEGAGVGGGVFGSDAGEFEGGEAGVLAKDSGSGLVGGDVVLFGEAGSGVEFDLGEPSVATAVAGFGVVEAGEDGELVFEWGEGLEDAGEFGEGAGVGGGEVLHFEAVGEVDEEHPAGRGGRGFGSDGFELREGDGGTGSAEEGAAGELPGFFHGEREEGVGNIE